MTEDAEATVAPVEVFKALGDPVRWSIIAQMAKVDELACVTLETTLPISKPTISYHTKILIHAGLINVRKEGRNYYYSLRREALHEVLDNLWELAPTPRPVVGHEKGYVSSGRPGRRTSARRRQSEMRDAAEEAVVLTW
jgi:DNA-binding transcriptional ArsR family regulator